MLLWIAARLFEVRAVEKYQVHALVHCIKPILPDYFHRLELYIVFKYTNIHSPH